MHTQTEVWALLTHLCQGGFGITDMPLHIELAIHEAYRHPVPPPNIPQQSCAELSTDLRHKSFTEAEINLIAQHWNYCLMEPYYSLTVDNIEVNLPLIMGEKIKSMPTPLARIIPTKASEFRPHGRGLSLTCFQFIYKEKNIFLQHPNLIWQRLIRLNLEREFYHAPFRFFPLLITLIGIRHNIINNDSCYVQNITQRHGYKPTEVDERKQLFPLAIEYLIEQTVAALRKA